MDGRVAQIQRAIGLMIKARRAAIGMSQETLSAAIGLSRSSVANIESGRQKIGVSLLYLMADVLQTTPHELLPPYQGKTDSKGLEIPMPKELPAEEQKWIRRVINPARKRGRRSP